MCFKELVAGGFYNMWMANAFKRMGGWRLLEYVDGQCLKGWVANASHRMGGLTRLMNGRRARPDNETTTYQKYTHVIDKDGQSIRVRRFKLCRGRRGYRVRATNHRPKIRRGQNLATRLSKTARAFGTERRRVEFRRIREV